MNKRSFSKRNKFYGSRYVFAHDDTLLVHYTTTSKFRFQNGKPIRKIASNPFSLIKTKRLYFV